MQQIAAGQVYDIPGVTPIGEHTRYVRQIHMVQPFVIHHIGGPVGIRFSRSVVDVTGIQVCPVGSVVRNSHSNAGSVHPGHTIQPLGGCPAIGVQHVPAFGLAVPNHYGIGGAIVDGVRIQRLGSQPALFGFHG